MKCCTRKHRISVYSGNADFELLCELRWWGCPFIMPAGIITSNMAGTTPVIPGLPTPITLPCLHIPQPSVGLMCKERYDTDCLFFAPPRFICKKPPQVKRLEADSTTILPSSATNESPFLCKSSLQKYSHLLCCIIAHTHSSIHPTARVLRRALMIPLVLTA